MALPDAATKSGRFEPAAVARSIDRSLARLGRIDRLLLHEVWPADIDDALLKVLQGYTARGDVLALGVATANMSTAAALRRGAGMFTVAHVSVDPMRARVAKDGFPQVRWVGHGALGADGKTLRVLSSALAQDARLARRWAATTSGTPFAGPAGLASALFAHAAAEGYELIVATRRLDRVSSLIRAASVRTPLPRAAFALISEALRIQQSVTPHP